MKKLMLLFSACALVTTPASAMTGAECKSAWTNADTNKDGVLTDTESGRYLDQMRAGQKAVPADGKITDAIFMQQCTAGTFKMAEAEPGAPMDGANSFTENQAKDRIVAAGFTAVTGLVKDDKGVWRGAAKKADKEVKVAVDYKGNVVAY